MVTFTQQLIAAAATHQFMAIFVVPGRGIGRARRNYNQDAEQGELRGPDENTTGFQS
jgi:hypothetical protein